MTKRFRKVYIVCEDNQIFNNLAEIRIYKYRDTAEFACRRAQDKTDAEE